MLHLAFGMYLANLAVGLVAQVTGVKFGRAHHGLYAIVTVAALGALISTGGATGLWLTVGALAVFPGARPRTVLHPILAVVGLIGYLVTYVWP